MKTVLAAALACALFASPASADVYRISFSGTASTYSQCGGCQTFSTSDTFSGFFDYDSLGPFPGGNPNPTLRFSLSSPVLTALGVKAYGNEYLSEGSVVATPTSLRITAFRTPTITFDALVTGGGLGRNPLTLPTSMLLQSGTFGFTTTSGQGGSGPGFQGTLTALSVAGVPEPTTWAMMIAGFAAAAMALRRRRRFAVA